MCFYLEWSFVTNLIIIWCLMYECANFYKFLTRVCWLMFFAAFSSAFQPYLCRIPTRKFYCPGGGKYCQAQPQSKPSWAVVVISKPSMTLTSKIKLLVPIIRLKWCLQTLTTYPNFSFHFSTSNFSTSKFLQFKFSSTSNIFNAIFFNFKFLQL